MAFVFEEIDHSRGQELVQKVRPPVYAFQRRQVIDRQRDLVFVALGGHGHQPEGRGDCPSYYNLLWQGLPIAFQGYDVLESVDEKLVANIRLTTVLVPDVLINRDAELKAAIVDAMACYWSGRYQTPAIAQVQFPLFQTYKVEK